MKNAQMLAILLACAFLTCSVCLAADTPTSIHQTAPNCVQIKWSNTDRASIATQAYFHFVLTRHQIDTVSQAIPANIIGKLSNSPPSGSKRIPRTGVKKRGSQCSPAHEIARLMFTLSLFVSSSLCWLVCPSSRCTGNSTLEPATPPVC